MEIVQSGARRCVYGEKVEGRVCMSDDIFGHSCKF